MFYPIFIAEFGFTPQQIQVAPSIMFSFSALFALFFGVIMQRVSARNFMIGGSVVFILAYLALSQIQTYWHFLGIYVLFAFGIVMSGMMPSVLMVTRWFDKYRGLAVGILLMGSSFGAALFSGIVAPLLKNYGWRTTSLVLAGIMTIMVFIPFVILLRNHPSEKNTFADGLPSNKSNEAASMLEGFTVSDVVKMPVFYLLAFVTAVMWFCIVGVTQNQTIFFKDVGLDAGFSAKVLVTFGISAMVGKLLFGFLSDRFDKRMIMLLATISLAVGSAILRVMDTNPTGLAFIYAVVYGVGFSGAFTMIQVMIAEYFGGKNYPKILGLFTMIDTLAGSAGAIVLGSIRTNTGSYVPSFTLMLGLSLVAIAMVIVMRKPTPKAA